MKSNLIAMIGIFILSWLICFAGNYMFLKNTLPPVEEVPEEEVAEEIPEDTDKLKLTWNLSEPGALPEPPSETEKEVDGKDGNKTAKKKKKKNSDNVDQGVRELVDSLITMKAEPLQNEVKKLQKELDEAKTQVVEFEELLALVSGEADSIDQVQAKKLSKMLEGMKSRTAATILGRLDSRTNAKLLLLMKQKAAAKILSELPEERAAEIARYLSGGFEKSLI